MANDTIWSGLKSAWNAAKPVLNSNKSINNAWDMLGGGAEFAGRVFKDKDSIGNALTRTFAKNSDNAEAVIKARAAAKAAGDNAKDIKIPQLDLDYGKIAGSYIGVAAAGRVATGGGITKDKNGNTNLIGIPII